MRRLCSSTLLLALVFGLTLTAQAYTFYDNFNDGNANGWWLGTNPDGAYGNWRVENGTLAQDQQGDLYVAIVKTIPVATQSVETQLLLHDPAGYGGLTVWYQDPKNWVGVRLYPGPGIWVEEFIDGTYKGTTYAASYGQNAWHDMRVEANSLTGQLAVFMDESYLFTYDVTTTHRLGLSGVFSGNSGGFFDNFELSAGPACPVPEPSTLFLLGSGLAGLGGVAWRRHRR
jgi:hypothetical protein